jgi:hypothetical protein
VSVADRLILRFAIVAASLAWAGFVFTHTVGDPDRGERIAEAVLADEAARAQVVRPITNAVMSSANLPADQRPLVTSQVERFLRRPAGARAFIDTFAGGWSRMLGEDDSRGSDVDIAPIVADVAAATPGLDPASLPSDGSVVASVPRPRADLPWLGPVRRAVEVMTVPLALAAAVGAAVAFLIGDRRWVLRRAGIWAALAGGVWLVGPAVAVWAARRWATGADAVVRVAVEEAVSGLRTAAIVLFACGMAAVVASVVIVAPSPSAPDSTDVRRKPSRYADRGVRTRQADTRRPLSQVPAAARSRTTAPTMTMPAQPPVRPAETTEARAPVGDNVDGDGDAAADDTDALWKFYADPDQ